VYLYFVWIKKALRPISRLSFVSQALSLGTLKYMFSPQLRKKVSLKETLRLFQRNWYHDFNLLGIKTQQFDDPSYKLSQLQKEKIIIGWIDTYIKNQDHKNSMRGVEFFCADAYYSFHALNAGVGKMVAIDLAGESGEKRFGILNQAKIISKILGISERTLEIRKFDVMEFEEKCDFAFVLGGLYHIEDPLKLLSNLRSSVVQYIFIQTIVSLENESPDYFESPAPGWDWGSRFSASWLINNIEKLGFKIIESNLETAEYNFAQRDRGSLFLVCQPMSLEKE
jgi:hypothetical protein